VQAVQEDAWVVKARHSQMEALQEAFMPNVSIVSPRDLCVPPRAKAPAEHVAALKSPKLPRKTARSKNPCLCCEFDFEPLYPVRLIPSMFLVTAVNFT
jgi:hypothetical protein